MTDAEFCGKVANILFLIQDEARDPAVRRQAIATVFPLLAKGTLTADEEAQLSAAHDQVRDCPVQLASSPTLEG